MTTSAVVLSFLFIHIGVILVAAAYYVLSAALAPNLTTRARTRFEHRPWLAALLGLTISVPWVLAALFMLNMPAAGLKFAGAVAISLFVLFGLLGGASIAQVIGRAGQAGAEDHPKWSTTLRGGLFLALTWALPLVGWLGMLPLTLATGIGCFAMGVWPTRRAQTPVAVPAPPVPASA